MALSFTDYTLGTPITPNVNYKVALSKAGDHAYLLTSAIAEATLQLTLTAPTDEEWSNVETYVANGPIAGRIFPLSANTYYFRVVGPPSLAYDSTLAIKDLDLEWPTDITPTAIPTDGTPITSGFYSLDALSLEVGKFHSFSIVPAKSGNLVGKHETSDQHRFVATIFGVDAQGFPVSHMTSFANMEQSIFNFDTAKAILHLSAPESAEFNYTCSIASFSSGSGGSLTPSSDANITGAWSFTNITVPTPTQAGQAANKSYVDSAVASVPRFDTSEDYVLTGTWGFERVPMTSAQPSVPNDIANKGYVDTAVSGIGANFVTLDTEQTIPGNKTFTGGIMKTGSPSAPSDLTNKLYVDGQIAPTVKNVGNQNVAGVKTFTDGVTMADEAPLTFGVGADAVKFHGTGAGMSVIEGGTGAHLDVAVSTTFQEPTVFQDATSFSTMIKAEKGISFGITEGSSAMETLMEQNHPTLSAYGCKWTYTANNGYYQLVQRNNLVWLTFDPTGNVWFRKKFEVQGPATFTQGVTMGQTLNVAGLVTFTGDLAMAEDKVIYLSTLVNMGAISGGSVSLNGAPTGKFNTNLAIETSQGIKASGKISANGGLETTGTTSLGGGLSDLTTINGTLTVTGRITASEGITLPEGLDIMFGSSASIYSDSSSNIMIEGSAAGRTLLNQALRFPTDSVFDLTTGVNIETGDARYLKFVSTTKAAYDALTPKDSGTVYFLSDTTPPSWAIGDKEIVTTDFLAS